MRTLVTVAAAASAILALAACANAKPQQSASDYMVGLVKMLFSGQVDREWETLHPAQQKVVKLDTFVRCSGKTIVGELEGVKVVDEYAAPVQTIPGTNVKAASRAVTLKISWSGGKETDTFHAYLVNGRWRWSLDSATAVAAYKANRCP